MGFKWGVFSAVAAIFISVILGVLAGVNFLHIFLRAVIFGVLFFGLAFGLRFLINSFFPELLTIGGDDSSVSEDEAGARINITIDGTGEYAVPELFRSPGDQEELGNVEDLISGAFKSRSDSDDDQAQVFTNKAGIDRSRETGYNDKRVFDVPDISEDGIGIPSDWGAIDELPAMRSNGFDEKPVHKQEVRKQEFTPNFGDDSGMDGLPDLDSMAMAFSGGGSGYSPSPVTGGGAAAPVFEPMEPGMSEVFEPDRSQYTGNKAQPLQGDFNPKDMAKGISTVLSKDK